MAGFVERDHSKPTRSGECMESEPHYMVCGPCAVKAGEMHRAAAEVQEIVENAWDLLDMALKD